MKITEKIIDISRSHNLTQEEAYALFATSDGLKKIMGPENDIELRPLGRYEIFFLKDNPYGLKGSEGCKVLSFINNEMISFTWNAPPQFESIRASDYYTWVVVDFDQNKIRLRHLGWPEGKEWSAVYDYFQEAWASVLNNITKIN